MVGADFEVMSTSRPSRRATSDGPAISLRQTRPTKVPLAGSSIMSISILLYPL